MEESTGTPFLPFDVSLVSSIDINSDPVLPDILANSLGTFTIHLDHIHDDIALQSAFLAYYEGLIEVEQFTIDKKQARIAGA